MFGINKAWFGNLNSSVIELTSSPAVTYVWQRYTIAQVYHWQQYVAETYYTGGLTFGAQQTGVSCTNTYISNRGYYYYAWLTYAVNTSTGYITISNRTETVAQGMSSSVLTGPSGGTNFDLYIYSLDENNALADGNAKLTTQTIYLCNKITNNYDRAYINTVIPATAETSVRQGSLVNGDITSQNISEYPANGQSGSYWYVKTTTVTSAAGSYIDEVKSHNPQAYPSDGVTGDYWYKLIREE